ncbi:hypothetical protein OIU77_027806 [Salix suchowensis]|uniref:Epidermal patterning factor-like protein n=1 Tax=Salix suchowensis TaxID=1278906 RepID=A0ABQ9BUV7_9ROSI|nr:hypothetical protein OIU77_027806 [Salix suchowensis]
MKRALQSRLSSDFLLYTRDFWGVSQIFQRPELLFCAEGPAQRSLLRPIMVVVFIKQSQDKAFNLYRLFWTRTLTPQFGPEKKDIEIKEGMMNEAAAADYAKGIAKIGSTPPSCEHKCHGCSPCEAIQVPTISKTDNHHLNVNYANYEPEGWKCKCGPSFYSP